MTKFLKIFSIVVILALALPATALASGLQQDRIIFGEDFTLEAGDELDGDLLVFGGNVTLEVESLVDGDVFVLGGNVRANGEISGSVAILGGNLDLGSSAIVRGDVTSMGGNVDRAPGSRVEGEFVSGEGFILPFDLEFGTFLRPSTGRFRIQPFAPVLGILWFGFRTLILAALAVLVVMFWPDPTATTAQAVIDQPVLAGGLGLLTLIVAPALLLLLLITIIFSPISLLGIILLVLAGVFGWIALGFEVGQRLATALNWELQPAVAAGLGTLVFTFVLGGVGFVPCLGFIVVLLGISLGLGGVLLTRFGSRPYAPAAAASQAGGEGS